MENINNPIISKDQVIHFISDLHLSDEQPHLYELLEYYMQNIAIHSDQLFILGDLFELWIGDDHSTPLNQKVVQLLKNYPGKLFIGHGNRDFLIGNEFAKSVNAILIDEPYNFEWNKTQISLLHGDSLCTDDVAYQQMKQLVRSSSWQTEFLNQSVENRLAFAANLREQSKNAQQEKTSEIMDVNQEAVIKTIKDNQCDWLIHGHTHRPNTHQITLTNKKVASRIVLSDWREKGHYLVLENGTFESLYFSL